VPRAREVSCHGWLAASRSSAGRVALVLFLALSARRVQRLPLRDTELEMPEESAFADPVERLRSVAELLAESRG
jgi:hypothetical protein